jgi:signal transduction histidine kinase
MAEPIPGTVAAADPPATQQRLRRLLDANRSIVSELSLAGVLQRIVEAARDVVGAEYAALGVFGQDGAMEQFIHVGVSDEVVQAIGQHPKGLGVLGALLEDPGTIRTRRISEHRRFGRFPAGHPHLQSFLGVPIQVPGSVFGIIYLADRDEGEFTSEDEELVLALAATAGIAIENARLYEESRHRQEWLRARAEVARSIAASDQDAALELIVESVRRLAAADIVWIAHPHGDTGRLDVLAADGAGAEEIRHTRYERDGSLAGAALQRRSGVILAGAESYHEADVLPATIGRLGPVMAVPLGTDNRSAAAVVVVGRVLGRRQFTGSDLEMADSFATAAAIAMELAEARITEERLALFEDRERIARDLHDHVIQRLFAMGLRLQSVSEGLDDPEFRNRMADVLFDVDETIRSLRTAISTLRERPAGAGLRNTVLAVVETMSAVLPRRPEVIMLGPLDTITDPELVPDVEAVLREGLSNVARHAGAQRVTIRVEMTANELEVRICDDGCGIPPGSQRSGLTNLRRRARQYGGTLIVTSPEDGGTNLSWTIPVEL